MEPIPAHLASPERTNRHGYLRTPSRIRTTLRPHGCVFFILGIPGQAPTRSRYQLHLRHTLDANTAREGAGEAYVELGEDDQCADQDPRGCYCSYSAMVDGAVYAGSPDTGC